MVGIDLGVVPGLGTAGDIGLGQGIGEDIGIAADRRQYPGGLSMMLDRKVATVGTRIGDQLVFFIQTLGRVQDSLGAEPETLGGVDLQAG